MLRRRPPCRFLATSAPASGYSNTNAFLLSLLSYYVYDKKEKSIRKLSKSIAGLVTGLGCDGKLLIVAAALEPIEVSPLQLISGRRAIAGWPSGHAKDSEAALNFSALTGVHPMIETYPLEQAAEAYEKMISNRARFRVVLTMTD